MYMSWGYHLIIDAKYADVDLIRDKQNIINFIDELCIKTEMQKLGEPHFAYVPKTEHSTTHDITGFSVCQFILTSSIVIHFCEDSRSLYFDFFSCKKFRKIDVIHLLQEYFLCIPSQIKFLERDAVISNLV